MASQHSPSAAEGLGCLFNLTIKPGLLTADHQLSLHLHQRNNVRMVPPSDHEGLRVTSGLRV